ncbi:MAG TPA: NACHT domain-containing protein, partial [Methylomirabilota bacterium]|nr:NACHT domain-containing protein [Methylomirabilota bacterium]
MNKKTRITIGELWRIQSNHRLPVVIQGFPGMGKTTLMLRLALHAARCSLGRPDPTMSEHLKPALLPVFIRLGDYATKQKDTPDLPLLNYIEHMLNELKIPHVFPFFQKCLSDGRCLILFDGLDEVPQLIREQVQKAVKTFIREQQTVDDNCNTFNRFIITSRVAGYDQAAFSEYLHYTIAELTPTQRDAFLVCWCRAHVRHAYASESPNELGEEAIAKETERRAKDLAAAVQYHGDLTENPLLLTLLAIMKQNGIVLPKRRVELYRNVTIILFERQNIIRNLPPIPETEAIKRLGPLAFRMHEKGDTFIRESEVLNILKDTNDLGRDSAEERMQEAGSFLKRVRERGGIFVRRAGDYFGFFHRTFQEYFVARHILNEIGHGHLTIQEFINMVHQDQAHWREPLLLAVAHNSGESDSKIARDMICTLFETSQTS